MLTRHAGYKKKLKYQRLHIGEHFSLLAAGQELKIKTCFWIRRQKHLLSLFLSFLSVASTHTCCSSRKITACSLVIET